MVTVDDQMHIYVDFVPILSRTSPDDALGLLLCMYSIFELNFYRHCRAIRFIYSIFYGDKHFLSNSMRLLIKEKRIDILDQRTQQHLSSCETNEESTTMNNTQQILTDADTVIE